MEKLYALMERAIVRNSTSNFDYGMIAKGYSGIVSLDNYEVPLEPEEALRNVANDTANHHDYLAAGNYKKAIAYHLN